MDTRCRQIRQLLQAVPAQLADKLGLRLILEGQAKLDITSRDQTGKPGHEAQELWVSALGRLCPDHSCHERQVDGPDTRLEDLDDLLTVHDRGHSAKRGE